MASCRTCGSDAACKCGMVRWNGWVRKAMLSALNAAEAYDESVRLADAPQRRFELRDAMERAQGRVQDLQWSQLVELAYAR